MTYEEIWIRLATRSRNVNGPNLRRGKFITKEPSARR